MRTLRLALLALAIAVSALSASPALCAEAPEVINNKKTVLHKNFFDIPVALVPKMGYNFEKIEGGVDGGQIALFIHLERQPRGADENLRRRPRRHDRQMGAYRRPRRGQMLDDKRLLQLEG